MDEMSTLLSAAVSFIESVPYIFEQVHKKLSENNSLCNGGGCR